MKLLLQTGEHYGETKTYFNARTVPESLNSEQKIIRRILD